MNRNQFLLIANQILYLTIFSFYLAHSRDPWFHSCAKPIIRIRTNRLVVNVHWVGDELWYVWIIGINRTISTSKIKNMIVNRKNRNEKGIRVDFLGSNTHWKGDLFSRLFNFFDRSVDTTIIIEAIRIIRIDIFIIMNIIFVINLTL